MEERSLILEPGTGSGVGVKRYDYSLTSEMPLDAESNIYPSPTPLEVDVHEGVEVGVLLAGGMARHLQDRVVPVLPGDVWLCASWEPHGWRVTKPGTRDVVLIFLPEFVGEERLGDISWLSPFAAPPDQRPSASHAAMRQKLLKVGQELLREIRGRRPAWRSAVRLEILRLLLALTREWRPPGEAGNPSQMSAGKLTRVRPALDLAHARLATSVSVAEAAEACNLSRSQFCLVFRDAMGLSYGRFCGRLRLGLAAKLLLSTDVSIASIAQRTGYVDASHLHRAFAKQYGCTPGAYRMQHRPQLHTRTAPSPT